MADDINDRFPRLPVWTMFGHILNPKGWIDIQGTEEEFRNFLGTPVEGYEEDTPFGAGAYLFNEFGGIFKANGVVEYSTVEASLISLLQMAYEIWEEIQKIPRVELWAKVLQKDQISAVQLPGKIFIETYLTQKVSNGVSETMGHIGNLYRDGVRASMGILFLEANLRLHFMPPLEQASKWFEYVRKLWVNCLCQKAVCNSRAKKRQKRQEIVDPQGNDDIDIKSETSMNLARKRKRALRLMSLLELD